MLKDHLSFALGNLRNRRLRSWLTMIGIFIGIAAVVSLIGLGEGLRSAINSQFGFLGTDILSVTASGGFGPPGTGVVNPLTYKELGRIRSIEGVEGAAGRLIESTKLVFNKKAVFSYAASMPDRDDRKLVEDLIKMKAMKGRLLKDDDKNDVVLGYSFFENDVFGKPVIPGSKIKVQDKEFNVVGVMERKGNFQVDSALLMNEKEMRELFGIAADEHDVIAVRFDQNSDVKRIKTDIEKSLRKIRNVKEGEEDFAVQTPASILESVTSVLLAVQIFVYIIAGISLLVGGIGIMNTMYTAVVERTKKIGIMKSIGAKNSTIFSLFFIESGFLGAVGGIIGVIIGFAGATGFVFIGRLILQTKLIAVSISLPLVIGALLFSFVLGS